MTNDAYSRQQARAELRAIFKELRSLRKEHALKTRTSGGAASVSLPKRRRCVTFTGKGRM
ncbi:hypothetical protein [Sedimentimonas flavescens]|uniref:hypothetical protein n=1 Tax=Sedimentimonas flavescens TaxID=2851012 RepID=UPI0021A80877|nr:hypothetical protein [Sedimentimonas flavescens]MCT2538744.1 hypothetical protein [Sedimentimonas flavescens]